MKLQAFAKNSGLAILMGALVISSCTVTSVVLDRMNDRGWLYDLARHPTRSKWDKHIDEVVYLVSVGDKQALSAARILFPTIFSERSRFPKSDRLADEMYAVAKLNGIEKLPVEEQIAWIRYYDQHPPAAWHDVRDNYKRQHQEPFSMIPEPPELIAAATEPASQAASVIAAAQPATAPAVAATAAPRAPEPQVTVAAAAPAATQKTATVAVHGATQKETVVQATAPKVEPLAMPAITKPTIPAAITADIKKPTLHDAPAALQKMPQGTLKSATTATPAPADDKPTPPDGAL